MWQVGRLLFEQCIHGLLRDKVVVLVTHQLQFLRQADELVVLGDSGAVVARGTFDELTKQDTGLSEILRQLDHHDEVHSFCADPFSMPLERDRETERDRDRDRERGGEGRKEGRECV